ENDMSRILQRTAGVIAADPDGIAAAQTLGAAGPLALVSDPVEMSPGRRVEIDSDGNDIGVVFTITGTRNGSTIIEQVQGANAGVATSTMIFDSVISIEADGATADDVEAGWGTQSVTSWIHVANLNKVRLVVDVPTGATVSYGVEATAVNLLREAPGFEPPVHPVIAATEASSETVELETPWSAVRLVVASNDAPVVLRAIPTG